MLASRSQPYGIAVINDVVWYSESGVEPNTLVRFDPTSEKFQTWKIPSGRGTVRNMSVTNGGNLVLAESGVNKIALVEHGAIVLIDVGEPVLEAVLGAALRV